MAAVRETVSRSKHRGASGASDLLAMYRHGESPAKIWIVFKVNVLILSDAYHEKAWSSRCLYYPITLILKAKIGQMNTATDWRRYHVGKTTCFACMAVAAQSNGADLRERAELLDKRSHLTEMAQNTLPYGLPAILSRMAYPRFGERHGRRSPQVSLPVIV